MPIKIYNSLTGKKEEFKPIRQGEVKMYVCGPTVYDESHLGHLRAAFVFDIIRRYLEFSIGKVTFVRNITDVDDKIINRAREELSQGVKSGKTADLTQKVREIAEYYTRLYEEDMENFGIKKPDIQPKATEHIADMIAFIQTLIEKGMAYEAEGGVYFQVRNFAGYGKLSHQSIDQMMVGARIGPDEKKKDPLDFALWKKAKPEEPFWLSPWGKGRPGWHIECSAMSTKYLGCNFDIHAGGRDLIFPHHENEIAQAEATTGTSFANYWLHNGLLTINGQKMAKSLGNFITIRDVLKKTHPDALKILFLSSHYSHPVDYSEARLKEAEKARERFEIFFSRLKEISQANCDVYLIRKQEKLYQGKKQKLKELEESFIKAMDDDFNTAEALAKLFEMVNLGNQTLSEHLGMELKNVFIFDIGQELRNLGLVLGLFQSKKEKTQENQQLIDTLKRIIREHREFVKYDLFCQEDNPSFGQLMKIIIEIRQTLRKNKEFDQADNIRSQLQNLDIIIEDKKDTTTWRMSSF